MPLGDSYCGSLRTPRAGELGAGWTGAGAAAGTTVTTLTWAEGPDEAAHLAATEELLASIEFPD